MLSYIMKIVTELLKIIEIVAKKIETGDSYQKLLS